MDEADTKLIEGTAPTTLAAWWCALNCWEWPAEIPNPEPVSDSGLFPRRSAIMRAIEMTIGAKECLRYWNRDRLPGPAFDAWWAANHGKRK